MVSHVSLPTYETLAIPKESLAKPPAWNLLKVEASILRRTLLQVLNQCPANSAHGSHGKYLRGPLRNISLVLVKGNKPCTVDLSGFYDEIQLLFTNLFSS
ncbi:hypothetical protein V1477_019656 [Vespula maculifrons]|uniref:Uncharacterized protein n=1 Tax=Vespula maculifrons TaxID=7453 RepID=A0ABD2ATR9_VESMC